MKRLLVSFSLVLIGFSVHAQFAPQAGVSGTDAIHKGSTLIKGWANSCVVSRGRMDIADLSSGLVSVGSDADACGAADGMVVSLGDSGVATLSFNARIFDGPGPDFAVFENGFANPANPEESFMELGFVEVSSDGEHFFRFPSISNSGTATQVPGAGVYMNARLVHNLAGKYIAQYGTPFDLADLKGVSGLDLDRITHIRVVDVVGSIGTHASRDSKGQLVNDPYPTKFASGGFDLDAVAAINLVPSGIRDFSEAGFKIYPIPAFDELSVAGKESIAGTLLVNDLQGRLLLQQAVSGAVSKINIGHLPAGTYFLSLNINDGSRCSGTFTKY
jgi:hypothetical protein